ncbi:hypothetical protein LZ30DRAFT_708017 [Colletotrichum cereale]|nr:hypothetical protein LZ30DRAFT_708017 [Colletotrichum cereale]
MLARRAPLAGVPVGGVKIYIARKSHRGVDSLYASATSEVVGEGIAVAGWSSGDSRSAARETASSSRAQVWYFHVVGCRAPSQRRRRHIHSSSSLEHARTEVRPVVILFETFAQSAQLGTRSRVRIHYLTIPFRVLFQVDLNANTSCPRTEACLPRPATQSCRSPEGSAHQAGYGAFSFHIYHRQYHRLLMAR